MEPFGVEEIKLEGGVGWDRRAGSTTSSGRANRPHRCTWPSPRRTGRRSIPSTRRRCALEARTTALPGLGRAPQNYYAGYVIDLDGHTSRPSAMEWSGPSRVRLGQSRECTLSAPSAEANTVSLRTPRKGSPCGNHPRDDRRPASALRRPGRRRRCCNRRQLPPRKAQHGGQPDRAQLRSHDRTCARHHQHGRPGRGQVHREQDSADHRQQRKEGSEPERRPARRFQLDRVRARRTGRVEHHHRHDPIERARNREVRVLPRRAHPSSTTSAR